MVFATALFVGLRVKIWKTTPREVGAMNEICVTSK